MGPKDVVGIANSVDPDQTAPLRSTLFAQTCLSKNLGSLRYLGNYDDMKQYEFSGENLYKYGSCSTGMCF